MPEGRARYGCMARVGKFVVEQKKGREDNSSTSITIKHRMIFCLRPRTKRETSWCDCGIVDLTEKAAVEISVRSVDGMELAITIDDCVMVGKS